MISLYLARHGETEENVRGILQGITPGHLTDKGKRQAAETGAELRGMHFDHVISSPLLRSRVTTEIILSQLCSVAEKQEYSLPEGQAYVVCPLLRERDWGSLTLRPYAEGKAFLNHLPADVETLAHGYRRAAVFVRFLLQRYDDPRGEVSVLAVGHGFIDRCILSVITGKDKSDIRRMENGEVRRIGIPSDWTGEQVSRLQQPSADEVSAN